MSLYWKLSQLQLEMDDHLALLLQRGKKEKLSFSRPATGVFRQLPNTPPREENYEDRNFFGSLEALRKKPPTAIQNQSQLILAQTQTEEALTNQQEKPKTFKRYRTPSLSPIPEEKPAKKTKSGKAKPKPRKLVDEEQTKPTLQLISSNSKPPQAPKSSQLFNATNEKVTKFRELKKKRPQTHREHSKTPPSKRPRPTKKSN